MRASQTPPRSLALETSHVPVQMIMTPQGAPQASQLSPRMPRESTHVSRTSPPEASLTSSQMVSVMSQMPMGAPPVSQAFAQVTLTSQQAFSQVPQTPSFTHGPPAPQRFPAPHQAQVAFGSPEVSSAGSPMEQALLEAEERFLREALASLEKRRQCVMSRAGSESPKADVTHIPELATAPGPQISQQVVSQQVPTSVAQQVPAKTPQRSQVSQRAPSPRLPTPQQASPQESLATEEEQALLVARELLEGRLPWPSQAPTVAGTAPGGTNRVVLVSGIPAPAEATATRNATPTEAPLGMQLPGMISRAGDQKDSQKESQQRNVRNTSLPDKMGRAAHSVTQGHAESPCIGADSSRRDPSSRFRYISMMSTATAVIQAKATR